MKIRFELNGKPLAAEVRSDQFLVDVIRALGLTGTKEGCGAGVCGACTVLVDELPVSSCLYLAASADGRAVWTVEGIAERAPDLVQCFVEAEGMQCGICTPGQVVSAFALKADRAAAGATGPPGETEIRAFMAGNLCRCTGYQTIIEAVRSYLDRA